MFLTFALLAFVFSLYLLHVHRCYSFFRVQGIDGPRPRFFIGNLDDFTRTKRISISIHNWTRQFGRIFGYFEGHTPVLVVSHPDVLEEIFIKNFSKFHSRRQFPLEDRSTKKGVHLFSATGDHWRRQRSILNPTFSPMKIKRMFPMIDDCVRKFLSKINERCPTESCEIEIYQFYKSLTMDLIWRCCFGIETDIQNDPTNPYLVRSQQVFARESSTFLSTLLSIFIPELQPCWLILHSWMNRLKTNLRRMVPLADRWIDDDPNEWLKENVEQIIVEALKNPSKSDLLHLMLDAVADKDRSVIENANQRDLTLSEVKQNLYLFMIAGYETASTALAYVTHVLASNLIEQKKLQKYIDEKFQDQSEIDFEMINQLDYLDWFVREALRIYPVTPIVVNRQCSENIVLPGFGRISSGTKLTLDIYSLHFDEDLWGPVDPKIFYPERFATKRHPLAWLAFGAGPRNCIGMRFALTEMKIVLIHLLSNFNVLPTSSTEQQFQLIELVTIAPKNLSIRLERRQNRRESSI